MESSKSNSKRKVYIMSQETKKSQINNTAYHLKTRKRKTKKVPSQQKEGNNKDQRENKQIRKKKKKMKVRTVFQKEKTKLLSL